MNQKDESTNLLEKKPLQINHILVRFIQWCIQFKIFTNVIKNKDTNAYGFIRFNKNNNRVSRVSDFKPINSKSMYSF